MNENEIFEKLVSLNEAYRKGDAIVSDAEYDSLKLELEKLNPSHPFVNSVELVSTNEPRKEKLPRQMKSLNKVKSFSDLKKWFDTIGLKDYDALVVMPKYDGISLLVDEKNMKAWTRGSSDNEGQKSDKHLRQMIHGNFGEYQYTGGEAIISRSNWENHFQGKINQKSGEPYKTRRGTVAGLFSSEVPLSEIQYVSYLQYLIPDSHSATYSDDLFLISSYACKEIEFNTFFVKEVNEERLNHLYELWNKEFDIDGLVITVDSKFKQEELGRNIETENPNYSIAYKANFETIYRTKVLGVSCNVSKNGYLRPTVQIDPVCINGAYIDNPTGNNMRFILQNNIKPGSEIDVILSGSVIPKIIKCYDKTESAGFILDKFSKCPVCGHHTEWNKTMTDLVCMNEECSGKELAKIIYFFKCLEFEDFSEGIIKNIFESLDVLDLIDFLELPDCAIESVRGIGKDIVLKYRSQLDAIVTGDRKVSLAKIMEATDCFEGIGEKKAQTIIDGITNDQMHILFNKEVKSDDIMFLKNIKGISISSIYSLENGMYDFIDFVENSIIPVKIEKCDKVESSGSLLSGVSVCFTGVRDKDMEEKIQNSGGKILSGVSKNTTHLILDDINSTSSKASKARELGIILLTIEKAKELWKF